MTEYDEAIWSCCFGQWGAKETVQRIRIFHPTSRKKISWASPSCQSETAGQPRYIANIIDFQMPFQEHLPMAELPDGI